MRSVKFVAVALVALTFAGTAWGRVSARSDHQNGIDFSAYSTFELRPGTAAAIGEIQTEVETAVVARFQERGLRSVTEGADLVLVVHAPMASQDPVKVDGFGYGGRDWPGWRVWGPTSINLRQIRPGTLVVDLLDAGSGELVWRGVAKNALVGKVKKLGKKVAKAAEDLASDYPPGADD